MARNRPRFSRRLITLGVLGALDGAQAGLAGVPVPVPGTPTDLVVAAGSVDVQTSGGFTPARRPLSQAASVLAANGPATATFRLGAAADGYHDVRIWWPTASASTPVRIIVRSAAGEVTMARDQAGMGGQWNLLGTFLFKAGQPAEVVVSGGAGLMVDTLRLTYAGAAAPALEAHIQTPPAYVGQSYGSWLDIRGGVPPYRVVPGATLPAGLEWDGAGARITGMPQQKGTYDGTVQVIDRNGSHVEVPFRIDVAGAPPAGRADVTGSGKAQVAAAPDLSGLVSVLAALPAGRWVRVNLNNYSDVWTPSDLIPMYGQTLALPDRIIQAWSGFAWDSRRGDLIIYGGGHANYPGNDVYRWHATTRLWERASLPSAIVQDANLNAFAVDGPDHAPAAAHTYQNSVYLGVADRFLTFGGAAFNTGGTYARSNGQGGTRSTGPYMFNPALADGNKVGGSTGSHVTSVAPHPEVVGGNMWQNRDSVGNLPGAVLPASHVDGCAVAQVENGKDAVYVAAYSGGGTAQTLYRYTIGSVASPASDTWETMGRYWSGVSDQPACAYDPVQRIFVKRGVNDLAGNLIDPFEYWDLNGAIPAPQEQHFEPVDPTGEFHTLIRTSGSAGISLRDCGMAFDPVRRQYALWCGDGRVWMMKPPAQVGTSGWTIAKQPAPGTTVPNGDVMTGIIGKWKYISNLDAFMGLQDLTQGNIWLYKPVGWVNPTTPPPPPPPAPPPPTTTSTTPPTSSAPVSSSNPVTTPTASTTGSSGGGGCAASGGNVPDPALPLLAMLAMVWRIRRGAAGRWH